MVAGGNDAGARVRGGDVLGTWGADGVWSIVTVEEVEIGRSLCKTPRDLG